MSPRIATILVVLATSLVLAAAAAACGAPYLRAGYGGEQLRMHANNDLIFAYETGVAGLAPGQVPEIGVAYGPDLSAGIWLTPALRVGATYSFQRAVRQNRAIYPRNQTWTHRSDFRIAEIGAEAAMRVERLAGLTLGLEAGAGRGELIETAEVQAGTLNGWRRTAHQIRFTGGAYVGLDQTNRQGVAGFVRAGYRLRDLGSMPSGMTEYALGDVTTHPGPNLDLDFSGFYVTVGVGFDGTR